MTQGQAQAKIPSVGSGALFVTHLLVTFVALALLVGWWFGVHGSADNSAKNQSQRKNLDSIGTQLELRLQNIQLLGKVINDGILTYGSRTLIDHVRRVPDAIQRDSGLLAVSWWPKVANSAPRYLTRTDNSWAEFDDLDSNTISAVRAKPWFALAPHLATGNCLWSSPEREAVSGQTVLSCSRAVFDSREYFLGVLRFSFTAAAFSSLLSAGPNSSTVFLLENASGALLASNQRSFADVRSLADVGQRQPEISTLATSLHVDRADALGALESDRNFPQHIAQALGDSLPAGSSATSVVAAAIAGPSELQTKARCLDQWCAEIRSLSASPWRVIAVYEQATTVAISKLTSPQNQPLLLFGSLIIGLAALNYFLLLARWKHPLSLLTEPLARNEPGPAFNESLNGVWGALAQKLNQLSEENQQLRHINLNPITPKTEKDGNQLDINSFPLAAFVIGGDGQIIQANDEALERLGISAGMQAAKFSLTTDSQDKEFSFAQLPNSWHEEACTITVGSTELPVQISTHKLPREKSQLVVVGSRLQNTPSTPIAQGTPNSDSPIRQLLASLNAPVHWLTLQVEPETMSPAFNEHDSATHFREQIQARIEDRLIEQETLFKWGPGHFVVAAQNGISDDRADDIFQAIQTSLIFLSGERIKVRARSSLFVVRPHMSSQELDTNIVESIHTARGETNTNRPKTYSPETLSRLIVKGFSENRFQLITEHGTRPGEANDTLSFRVLPHLEDDEGFWMGADEYFPMLARLKRRAEHDTWLIDAVHGALQNLNGAKPEQVIIPLCGFALTQSDNQVAEKLSALARDPALTESTIYVSISEQDKSRAGMDPKRLRNVVHNLGCRLAWSNVDMDTRSLAQIEAIRPDMIILRGSLVQAALDSTTIGIGVESIIRAGEKLKCSTVVPNIDSEQGRQLVDKLHPTLAFGLAIGKPSPLPFRAVA